MKVTRELNEKQTLKTYIFFGFGALHVMQKIQDNNESDVDVIELRNAEIEALIRALKENGYV